jgi:hypothetical protein
VEIYGKNAERFLLLRPSFSNKNINTDKQVRVSFDQNEDTERYECTFGAYLEV